MAKIVFDEPSRTFAEYLLLPGLTTKRHTPDNVSLRTPLTKLPQRRRAESDAEHPIYLSDHAGRFR